MATLAMMGQRRDPLRPPEAPGMGRGVAFALVAHVLLLAALSSGVQWRTKTLPTFEAELWSAVPQAAAPKEVIPPAPPEPEVKPEPKPQPPQPKVEDLQAQRDAEIAIDKARAQKVKRELERLADLEAQRKRQAAEDKLRDKEKADKRAADDKQQKLDQAKLDKQKQAKDDKAKADKDDARREAQRQDNLRRIQGMAGASGGPGATGSTLQSKGPSASYGGRVVARIKPNVIFSYDGPTDLIAEVEVRVAPDGRIISRRLIKASADSNWNEAVLRAIDKTEMLPRDTDGSMPPLLTVRFNALDLGH